MLGTHTLKTWSTTQATMAMSSAEAEYYALIEGAVRSLGLQSMLRELGLNKDIKLRTDSSAAEGFSSQRGLGRMRHLEVKELWLQEAVCRGRLHLCKVKGDENPADLFTKYLGQREVEVGCARMSIEISLRE